MIETCTHCPKEDVTLSTGRRVTHRPMTNGAHEAVMVDGPDTMSEAEWDDYCAIVKAQTEADRKARYFKTARTTIACAHIPAGEFVAVRYSHTGANGVQWFDVNGGIICYPAHHLAEFCL